jgi:hypothetical protein
MAERLCMHNDGYPAAPSKRKCVWHLLLKEPTEVQIEAAEERRAAADAEALRLMLEGYPYARWKKEQWPPGERWCAGCQGFVPLFYCTGSRCKAHNAQAAHSGALLAKYDITRADYLALLELQGGVCYVCGQTPRSKRLAVDHDHKTGIVRGLLCSDLERGCNHAVLGSLEARSVDGVIAAAYRLIDYMTKTPFQRLKEAPSDQTDIQRSEDPSGTAERVPGELGRAAAGDHGDVRGAPDRPQEADVPTDAGTPPGQPARRPAALPGPPGPDWRDDPDWSC